MSATDHLINSQLICADYEKTYPKIVSGKGAQLYDESGRAYLDCSGCTAAVTSIGHGVQEIAEVLAEQAGRLAVHPTHVFDSPVLQDYLANLCAFAPEGFNRAWTISGGTEAVENAIKLAFQYHKAKGRSGRSKVLGRWSSYHGNSILALDVGGMKARRGFYTELMVDHPHVSPCLPYRRPAGQSEEEYEDSLIAEFRETVSAHKDELVCFVAEPMVGAALGAAAPTANYFARIAEICQQHDILMIADEVMTGFGRTGKAFGVDHWNVIPDIIASAKGMAAGYIPTGGIFVNESIINTIKSGSGAFIHGHTYNANPLSCRAVASPLTYIKRHNLIDNVNQNGKVLGKGLRDLAKESPFIGDVRGMGYMWAMEIVQDKESKQPFPAQDKATAQALSACLANGLIVYPGGCHINGVDTNIFLVAPPLVTTKTEVDKLLDRLHCGLTQFTRERSGHKQWMH